MVLPGTTPQFDDRNHLVTKFAIFKFTTLYCYGATPGLMMAATEDALEVPPLATPVVAAAAAARRMAGRAYRNE